MTYNFLVNDYNYLERLKFYLRNNHEYLIIYLIVMHYWKLLECTFKIYTL